MDIVSYLLGKNAGGTGGGVTIESGSNEHGNYIKFSSGDMIQYGILVVEADSAYVDYILPVDNVDDTYTILSCPLCAGSSYGGSAAIRTFAVPQIVDKSSGYIYSYQSANTTINFNRKVAWVCFGKWK